jgi:hypothetical protein
MTRSRSMRSLTLTLVLLSLPGAAYADEPPARHNHDALWAGYMLIAASLLAGGAITTIGLTYTCRLDQTSCLRAASMGIWGGVAIAGIGTTAGLLIIETNSGLRVSVGGPAAIHGAF